MNRFLFLTLLVTSPAHADPLASEIGRCTEMLKTDSDDATWKQIKELSAPLIAEAEKALAANQRHLALVRLASARVNPRAWKLAADRPEAQKKELAAFEAEWKRMGGMLKRDLSVEPKNFTSLQPALVRAVAEVALPQVGMFYRSSLEYARSTEPQFGIFYLGAAQAQQELAALARQLSAKSAPSPKLRSLAGELDALEAEMLALYRPPLSIDEHSEFIAASAVVKEARELDAAGLRHGALLRYLQAVLRFAQLRPTPPAPAELAVLDDETDHSIGRLFLETAAADPKAAPLVAADVLPRYLAALRPAKPVSSPKPQVTVTLVRWPFT